MKSTDPQISFINRKTHKPFQQPTHPMSHFRGCFVGKGNSENLARIDSMFKNQMAYSVG
jgi:hypothetical protein